MAETQATTAASDAKTKANWGRKRLRAESRKKRREKISTDKEFAKSYFEGKSKRSAEKKVAFRKRRSKR